VRIVVVLVATILTFAGCKKTVAPDPGKSPPAPILSIPTLLAAPDSLLESGDIYLANTYVYRNFHPVVGGSPDARSFAFVYFSVTLGELSKRPKYVWVIHGGETWGAELHLDYDASFAGFVEATARGGPEWPLEDSVRTVVGVPDSTGQIHLLRCPDGVIKELESIE
jgi:hypothetical protein